MQPLGSIQVRDGLNFGRFNVLENTTASRESDATFLDSNDSGGIIWTISRDLLNPGNGGVRGAGVFIGDAGDVGGTLSISATVIFGDGAAVPEWAQDGAFEIGTIQRRAEDGRNVAGNVWRLNADLESLGDWTRIDFRFAMAHPKSGFDGFALSNPTIGAIPLPAPALLLLTGMGVLGGVSLRRRRR